MSQENVELVREAVEAYNTGGIDALLPFFPPDVVVYPIPEWVEDPVYEGHDGFRRLIAWMDDFDDVGWEIQEMREARGGVLVRADLTGRMKASGVAVRQEFGIVGSDFRDGMVGEWRFFRTWPEALKAVGLEE
jgi:hypothetical protein